MNESLHLTIRYEDAGDGWVMAQVAEVPGAISQGKTREEARANVLDALDLVRHRSRLAGERNGADSESVTLTVSSLKCSPTWSATCGTRDAASSVKARGTRSGAARMGSRPQCRGTAK